MAANPPPHQQQNGTNQAQTGLGSRVSQRQFFEQAWGAHEPNRHPEALRLHVERRERDAKKLTFREMCGESAFIPPSELTTIRSIGSGSFAKVEICKYHPPGGPEQVVAVKRMNGNAAVDVEVFASEANILRKLKHKNIVGYIGVGSITEDEAVKDHTKSCCYLVQEFMDGGTLKQKVWRQSGLLTSIYSEHDAVEWGRQIAEGLAYLHSANPVVLHRDLKLENILLKNLDMASKHPRYIAKICDFGLAVSLLDPHFGWRPVHGLAGAPPSGLAPPRIDSHFHAQMKEHVLGNEITHPQIAADSKRMDRRLDRISKQPSFRRGDEKGQAASMTRGTPILAEAQSPSAKPTTLRSLKSLVSLRSGDSGMASMPEDEEEQLEQTRQHEAYQLTGRAGSFFYMAPEVVMCVPYNEKADIFSLGIVLFELFLRKTMAALIMEGDYDPGLVEMFAYKVAGGYRHPLPRDWPEELRQLISQCWAQDPEQRPLAADVARRLSRLEEGELFRKWEERQDQSGVADKCCVLQ